MAALLLVTGLVASALPSSAAAQETNEQRYEYVNHDEYREDEGAHKRDRDRKHDRKHDRKDDRKKDHDGYKKPKHPTTPPKTPPATEQPEKPELPVTGAGSLTVVGAGLLLVGFGIFAWLFGSRRRVRA